MSVRNLDHLFQPRSIAVIGASDRERSIGALVMRNLLAAGFTGPVWPVNPRRTEVAGLPAFANVASLPAVPDLAVLCTPALTVPELIDALGAKGTRAAIVLTAGLNGQRTADGRTLQQAMLDAARPHLLRVLGPNCLGLLVPGAQLNASFAHTQARPGRLAFVSQSGALATAMLDWANSRGIGFSHFISLGDSADVDVGDVLDYLASDGQTSAVLMYLESVRAGAQVHVGRPRGGAQQAGGGGESRPRARGRTRRSVAHRRAVERRCGDRRRAAPRRHAARRHAGRPVRRRRDDRPCAAAAWRAAGHRHQRRRCRSAGRRCAVAARRHARHLERRHAPGARCPAARHLVARQSDRPDRRRADRALHGGAGHAAGGRRGGRGALHACAHRGGAEPADRAGVHSIDAHRRQAGARLLAWRRRRAGGRAGVRGRRRADLRDAGARGHRFRASRAIPAQPGGAAADAAIERAAVRARSRACAQRDRWRARRGARPARRGRGQGAARRLPHSDRADARRTLDRRGGRDGGRHRLSGGAEDPVAAGVAQVRRRRRRARAGRRRRRAARRAGDGRTAADTASRCAARRLHRAGDGAPAARARALGRRRPRCGIRPAVDVRPGRHRGGGAEGQRDRAAAV